MLRSFPTKTLARPHALVAVAFRAAPSFLLLSPFLVLVLVLPFVECGESSPLCLCLCLCFCFCFFGACLPLPCRRHGRQVRRPACRQAGLTPLCFCSSFSNLKSSFPPVLLGLSSSPLKLSFSLPCSFVESYALSLFCPFLFPTSSPPRASVSRGMHENVAGSSRERFARTTLGPSLPETTQCMCASRAIAPFTSHKSPPF